MPISEAKNYPVSFERVNVKLRFRRDDGFRAKCRLYGLVNCKLQERRRRNGSASANHHDVSSTGDNKNHVVSVGRRARIESHESAFMAARHFDEISVVHLLMAKCARIDRRSCCGWRWPKAMCFVTKEAFEE